MITFQRRKGYINKATAQSRTGKLCVGIHNVGKGCQGVAQITRNGKRFQKRITIISIHNGEPVNSPQEVIEKLDDWVRQIKAIYDNKKKIVTVKRVTLNRSKK